MMVFLARAEIMPDKIQAQYGSENWRRNLKKI
jgi:hypothetical protein